jgi:mannose-6-phosphate isomerase-like protein (cupin superfamily)
MGRSPKHAWTSKSTRGQAPWGESTTWSATQGIHGKIINIHEGKRTSLKYHRTKNEVFFILSGVVRADFGSSKTLESPEKYPMSSQILKAGDVLNVQSECPYRLTALEDSVIVEVGDNCEINPVRIEDDYGRVNVKQS